MSIVVLDLEWNGAYCKKVNGYFNEIIEIGAVRLADDLTVAERFDAVIRPRVSRKLTHWVTDLTGYTDEQVKAGISFLDAMERLQRFIGEGGATLLTWSTTDLLVLMENCRYYYGDERIPSVTGYLDLQAYAQTRLELGTKQQIGLAKFAELLGMNSDDLALHHAIDDSVLSAAILRRVYHRPSFEAAVRSLDDEFYRRLTFKPTIVKELNDPAVDRKKFVFTCPDCGKRLKETGKWRFFHNQFNSTLQCGVCNTLYHGRVQVRLTYDGPVTKRRLAPKKEKQPEEA
ncbi:MAG: exonuclease domain-containing protein [Clostridia bacterium]|nr:exonuclease domain-containing protein [Clostridia bacterium]